MLLIVDEGFDADSVAAGFDSDAAGFDSEDFESDAAGTDSPAGLSDDSDDEELADDLGA